ncbi:uncharacterized protein J3R85_006470 [Psidium guajava]|nr:uncharacterized protein J3R85_006470 [Psidium guajava]
MMNSVTRLPRGSGTCVGETNTDVCAIRYLQPRLWVMGELDTYVDRFDCHQFAMNRDRQVEERSAGCK